ncbi:MAG: helix-turn-helix domain-containing protein [Myxococcota bacterium]
MQATARTPAFVERFVDAFWSLSQDRAGTHRVLPDGCIDFLFDLEDGSACVVGPMPTAELVLLPERTRLFGVRFRPGAASAFLDIEASELLATEAPLAELTRAKRWALAERIASAANDAQRAEVVARFIADAGVRRRPLDARVQTAVAALACDAPASVRAAAESVGVSERQLERLFRERVGVSPKQYARIARLQRAVSIDRAASIRSQAELAAQAGYADESHLLRDFRDLAGISPSALRLERDVGFVQGGAGAGTLGVAP